MFDGFLFVCLFFDGYVFVYACLFTNRLNFEDLNCKVHLEHLESDPKGCMDS
jgi:hypothetical protein